MKQIKNNKAVSLMELSASIAIIGILLGVIVEGVSIRKSSEIRGFMIDIAGFQVAFQGFTDKYTDWPGDMSSATSYWQATSNGDSNGQIEIYNASGKDETFTSWQQLSLSKFIGGSYSGNATNSQADIGLNVPAAKRVAVGYYIAYANTGDGARNEIGLGKFLAAHTNSDSALTPAEALAIDNKMDNGIPQTGIVHGIDGSDAAGKCVSGTGVSSKYNTSVKALSCIQTFNAIP
jgi:hypothetical protein